METIFYPAQLSGGAAAPASKSEAHRRMICAGLGKGETVLEGFMPSADMTATMNCLKALGASFFHAGESLTVRGAGRTPLGLPLMDCGESGSTLRFFVPIAMAMKGGGVFRMHGRLSQRPMDVYRDLFVPQGTSWHMAPGADGAAELHVLGKLAAGNYVLPGNVSSQFVSGLMFALPLLQGQSTLTVTPPVESAGYINMTLEALRDSGIVLREKAPFSWEIPGGQTYRPVGGRLSGDYSQAAVLLCMGALGHDVTVTGLEADTTQGDRAILSHLAALGAQVEETDSGIRVNGGWLRGTTLDVRDCPDVAPILALVCQLAQGESRLTGCGRLRLKECDRLAATVKMLNALGGCAREEGDDMVINGVKCLRGGVTVDVCNDHRMVMLASAAALRCQEPVTVTEAAALSKSWPGYLGVYAQLGGRVE
ncbi:MAG: 3-phosphoshikimate 1-carboxyvinyltransferase [Clostridia bacterium]|nr:3-phosphoshikimate 1-carboxyvinyltransferase [Clostridia bacterium]